MKSYKQWALKAFIRMAHGLKTVKKNKVLFCSFHGRNYADNPRAVSEALHALDDSVQIVWIFNEPETKLGVIPPYIRCVNAEDKISLYREIATARVFVNNLSFWRIPKSKKQMYIQTWHGDKAFKTVLYDSPQYTQGNVFAESIPGYCDLTIAGSEYGKRQYKSAFHYTGDILMEGTPRNDRLVNFNVEECQSIKQKLNIAHDTRLLLYAPTLRNAQVGTKNAQPIELDIVSVLNKLQERDDCQWVCLLRSHPTISGLCGVEEDCRIMDVSGYEDMADLLLISDILITDYSSCAGDFALLKRPLVLYQSDRQEYLEKDRTFYFDIDNSPYYVAQNQQELENIVVSMTPEKAKENCESILKFYGDCETGHAAQSVAQIIKDWIER